MPNNLLAYTSYSLQTNVFQKSFTLLRANQTKSITSLFRNRYKSLLQKDGNRTIALSLLAQANSIEGLRALPSFSICRTLREWREAAWDNAILQGAVVPYAQGAILSSKISRSRKQLEKAMSVVSALPGIPAGTFDSFGDPISYEAINTLLSP